MTKEELKDKAIRLYLEDKHQEIINLLPDTLLENFQSPELYVEKGLALAYLGKSDSIKLFQKAIEIDTDNSDSYLRFGQAYGKLGEYKNALIQLQKAVKLNPKSFNGYYFLAHAYSDLEDFDNALKEINKAIDISPESYYGHSAQGRFHYKNGEYDKAITSFETASSIKSNQDGLFYFLGICYFELKQYTAAKESFEKYLDLTNDATTSYPYKFAKAKLKELKPLIADTEYRAVSDIVSSIKELLLYKDNCVTHYTSISAAKALIIDKSKFRLSEGTFLNDTSEGRALYNFLPLNASAKSTSSDTIATLFASKPFIGSFVTDVKHDDLTLWRMYGKEAKEEAKGCAITIQRESFLAALGNSVIVDDKTGISSKTGEEFNFYRVAYKEEQSGTFTIPGATPTEAENLNKLMQKLHDKTKAYFKQRARRKEEDEQKIISLLNDITYLFKGAEYHYEQEIRLVIEGIGFPKTIDAEALPPKVYINMVSIRPVIQKITLGPKVSRADEWAAAFYYSLDEEGYNPEINMSHLPFK